MNKGRPLKYTGYYNLIIGLISIVSWGFLIISQNAEELSEELIKYIFHWLSELATSVLLIIAGIMLIRKSPLCINLMFLSLGFLLMAIGGAFVYYISNFELVFFIYSTLITGTTIILLILNFKSLKDFVFLTLGISIYALINILGEAIQQESVSLVSMTLPSLLFLILLTISLFNKDLVFKKMIL
jgi:hypothetical protein